jgi:hypothetical protein
LDQVGLYTTVRLVGTAVPWVVEETDEGGLVVCSEEERVESEKSEAVADWQEATELRVEMAVRWERAEEL